MASLLSCPSMATELTLPLGLGATPTGSISFEIRADIRPVPLALLPVLPTTPRPPTRLPPLTLPYPDLSLPYGLGGYGGSAGMSRFSGPEERSGGAPATTQPTHQAQQSKGAEVMHSHIGGGMGDRKVPCSRQ